MEKKTTSITFSTKLDSWCDCNPSFDSGEMRICYTGRNRNNMFLSKATIEKYISTMYNCPIVCRYDRAANEIGEHDKEVVRSSSGGVKIVNLTHPVGVIPTGAKWWWEEAEDWNGVMREYLCAEVVLWKREEAYEKIKENTVTDQSMEINIVDSHMKDGVCVIEDFYFKAFCLLGTAEPCYESASLVTFSLDNFGERLEAMMADYHREFTMQQSSEEVVIEQEESLEGGEEDLSKKKNVAEGQVEDTVNTIENEDVVNQVTEGEINETKDGSEGVGDEGTTNTDSGDSTDGDEASGEEPDTADNSEVDFALAGQIVEEIRNALASETIVSEYWGEIPRYWMTDYDHELLEVYCWDETDWNLYGFKYSMNGDNVEVDFGSKKRMKFVIAEFDNGTQDSGIGAVFSVLSEKHNEGQKKLKSVEKEFASMKKELKGLREFQVSAQAAAETKQREELFGLFADLSEQETFVELVEKSAEFTLAELEEKCYAIRGRMQSGEFSLKSKPQTGSTKVLVQKEERQDDLYGGLFSRFGVKPENTNT